VSVNILIFLMSKLGAIFKDSGTASATNER